VWTESTGPLTAPPLVHGEWLFVASGDQVMCYRVADGTRVWTRETGAVEQRVAVEGSRV
jgi:outer membrane protein assembly factor BamB